MFPVDYNTTLVNFSSSTSSPNLIDIGRSRFFAIKVPPGLNGRTATFSVCGNTDGETPAGFSTPMTKVLATGWMSLTAAENEQLKPFAKLSITLDLAASGTLTVLAKN